MPKIKLLLSLTLLMAGLLEAHTALASPSLRCELTYAGTTQLVQATPVADPYPVASVDIGGRFWFKPVMVGEGDRLDYVKLYTYLATHKQPLLLQEAIYRPPFQSGESPHALTGEQHLYGGPVERELTYSCTLQGVQP